MARENSVVKYGMVGGGQGAFIGEVHRLAARLDGKIELVCGAFSRDVENCKATGAALGLDASRCYDSFNDMMIAEAKLPENERMDFVSIVTPNHVHFPVAKAALEAGFHVLSDKPATLTLKEAQQLRKIVENSGKSYGLTHTYLGYPLVGEARSIIEAGGIGKVRKVFVEYIQGWLATEVDNKQADWRTMMALLCFGWKAALKAHCRQAKFAWVMKTRFQYVFTARRAGWSGIKKSLIRSLVHI